MRILTKIKGYIHIHILYLLVASLPEDVCEESVCPLSGVGVQYSVQVLLADGLGVNNVAHTLNPLQTLQGLQQDLPGCGLATPTGADHHEPVVELCDLVELKHL